MKRILPIAPLLFLLSSCKNKLELNAPYREIPSVYAVLCPQESIQMIRINKVFLGEGDANKMAQVPDSVNYPAGELSLTLHGDDGLGNVHDITFRDSVIQTEPGAFTTTQRVYVTGTKLFQWGTYTLTVKNNRSGNVFTSRAVVVDANKPSGFIPWHPESNYYSDPNNIGQETNKSIFINYDEEPPNKAPFSIRISPTNAILYQLVIRMHYYDSLITGINSYSYVDHSFPRQLYKDAIPLTNLGSYLVNSFSRADLLNAVAGGLEKNSLPASQIVGRKMYKIGFIVYKSTQDYRDYLEFAAPSLSIAQEKPLYSNFDNKAALGIFTFRSRYYVEREMAIPFKEMFAYSSITCKYRFMNSANIVPLCQ